MKKKIVCMVLIMMLALPGCGQKDEGVIVANGQGKQTAATEAPEATKAPEATTAPGTTRIPEVTRVPDAAPTASVPTKAPEATKTPNAAVISETTATPETTKAPNDSTATTKPDSTKEPERPAATQEPTVTEAPAEHKHTYVENKTPSTCTEAATITTVCSECGFESGTRTEGSVLGHSFYESVFRPASCTFYGWASDVCSRCGYSTGGRELPQLEHDYEVTRVNEGTCRRERSTSYRCKDCGWETVEYGDYNYDNHEDIREVTYTADEPEAGEFGEVVTYFEISCYRCNTVFEKKEISRESVIPE